jgi:23S rRNA pseudouridine1911/1915/1917 synthase
VTSSSSEERIPLDETELAFDSLPPVASSEPQRDVAFVVGEEHSGSRVDLFLTFVLNGYSRMFLRKIIAENQVQVDGQVVKPAFKVFAGHRVVIDLLPPPPSDGPVAENIPLDILFEDDAMVIVNKPAGMVVHPAKGHWSGTLTSALAYHFQHLSDAGGPTRPGIVHRLDRDTSGVIAIAKTNEVHFRLCAQFEARDVRKKYIAIVAGTLDRDRDRIVQPIGHHPYQRDKMACRAGHASSRDAETDFEVVERFRGYALINVYPRTGRTHQIRLHMAHVGCPVLCDRLYGGHSQITRGQLQRRQVRGLPPLPNDADIVLERQALHASQLEFDHPVSGERMTFAAPLPPDLQTVLELLRSA